MNSTRQPDPKRPSSADALTFNVAGLLAEPAGSIRDIEVASGPLDLGTDLHQRQGVSGRVRLTRTNRGLLVQARLGTSIDQECSRCLRQIDFPLDLELEEEALPSIDLVSGLPIDATAEPEVLRLNDHHELELENEIREAIMLSEPIAPLCRPDCPGLCPICGQELAGGRHDHEEEDVDPRLEALRDFKPGGEG
jgi:uncharacterized protein